MPENFYHNDWPYPDGVQPTTPSHGPSSEDASVLDYDQLDFASASGVTSLNKSTLDPDADYSSA